MPEHSNYAYGKSLEESYFLKKEQELISRLKEKAAQEAARRDLAQAVGVEDEAILQALEALGFTRDIVEVLHFFPLVAVAWADGSISPDEKNCILAAARGGGVAEGSPAFRHLQKWLTERPDEVTSDHALRIIRDIQQYRSAEQQQADMQRVQSLCWQVAEASGGFLGLGKKISGEEKKVLDKIAAQFMEQHRQAAEKLLGKLP